MVSSAHRDQVTPSGAMSNHRGGNIDFVRLHRGEPGHPGNFEFSLIRTTPDYVTPRHRHNFDQIHYILDGKHQWGPDQWMPTGSIGYFTEGCYYGPQCGGPSTQLGLQFGGASGSGFMSYDELALGNRELARRGTFDGGAYSWVDADGNAHRTDGYQAIWEHVNGGALHYPDPRYDKPIIIFPSAMQWRSTNEHGVRRKHAGTFGERSVVVAFIGLDEGATHRVEVASTTVLHYLLSGSLHVGDDLVQTPGSALKWTAGETGSITAINDAEIYEIRLPEFD
jgi:hypothetical protein